MNDPTKGLVSRDDTVLITTEVMVREKSIEVTCTEAAADGDLGVLKWLRAKGAAWDEKTCSAAAAGGHLEVLKWAREHDCPWDATTCKSAADGGHLEGLVGVPMEARAGASEGTGVLRRGAETHSRSHPGHSPRSRYHARPHVGKSGTNGSHQA
jgi:hypothetical protein